MLYIKLGFLLILLGIAAIKDYKTNKIPNYIFIVGLLSALIFDLFLNPIPLKNIFIKGMWLVVIFLFGALRLLGIGDIKLWMVISSYIGFVKSAVVIFLSSFLLIIVNVIKDRENFKLVFLTFSQIINKQEIKIVEQKAYPLAPYILLSSLIMCVYICFI